MGSEFCPRACSQTCLNVLKCYSEAIHLHFFSSVIRLEDSNTVEEQANTFCLKTRFGSGFRRTDSVERGQDGKKHPWQKKKLYHY